MDKTKHNNNCRKHIQTTLWENSSESKDNIGGHSCVKIHPKQKAKHELIEMILDRNNLNAAFKKVKENKGSPGIDGITTEELSEHLRKNKEEILGKIRARKYKPTPVKRVQIPKPNGKVRNLGIPITTDRVIQQAILQVLSPIYEKQFSDNSFGFRPGRGCHDALKRVMEYAEEGYLWVVDLDLEKFFDTVNQSKLIQILSKTIEDGDVISLIHKFLKAGIMDNGVKIASVRGVPQGGPLSPLLANIILNEADQELDKWGYKFVRYADDLLIFAKNRKAAERYYRRVKKLLETNLKLKVNEEKSEIRKLIDTKYLGYGFQVKDKIELTVHPESSLKFKAKLKEITGRSNGMSHSFRRTKLNQLIRGWIQYFKLANVGYLLIDLDKWLRRRIRACAWKAWKLPKTKFKYLKALGINACKAWQWSYTRVGVWKVAGSPIMQMSLTNKTLESRGYLSMANYYDKVHVKL